MLQGAQLHAADAATAAAHESPCKIVLRQRQQEEALQAYVVAQMQPGTGRTPLAGVDAARGGQERRSIASVLRRGNRPLCGDRSRTPGRGARR